MKVLATDLDGTLFYPKDKKNIICLENLKFIRDFIDEGNKVILISGRSFDFLKIVAYFEEKQEKLLKSSAASCKITKGVLERRECCGRFAQPRNVYHRRFIADCSAFARPRKRLRVG